MIVLGIDPGSRITGYGVVEHEGKTSSLVDFGVIDLSGEADHGRRLKQIYEGISRILEAYRPDACALEMPVYGKNPQSMLKLGRAQAAAMLAALNAGLDVVQYTPKEVKKSVTGNGNAAKEQVWFMVRAVLAMADDDPVLKLDASDALAVCLCHAQRQSFGGNGRYSGWGAFLNANPNRIVR
ncbi:MAG: crossover junction endodeoxyribonuclease RuvC [Bacteroidota bacterium]